MTENKIKNVPKNGKWDLSYTLFAGRCWITNLSIPIL